MKKIINSTDNLITEMLDGIVMAFPKDFKRVEGYDKALITPRAPVKNKVGIATGGGSGHLPLFLGYIGENLLDGAAVGDVFSSPSAETMLAITKAIDSGKGVLYLYGNYGGDIMNFDMAAEMAEEEGIRVETCIGCDDVASAPADDAGSRRGIAGLIFAYKIAGAKAATGASLEEVKETTDRALNFIRTMGVALSPCTIPAVGLPTFEIGDDEMEIGMGIHGERGIKREKLKSADEIASFMTERVIDDLPFESGDEVAVLVNGLGATAPQELYVTFRKVKEILDLKKIKIYKSFVGEYATSMEMKGLSITLFKLDREFKELLDMPVHSPMLLQQF
ncbi:MAG TPA: dihydroxyacetone kinase subunit DhaK [Mesotoga infera]|uniref:Dihydroxyacetone kinase subunit DhaK n=1 Tax=Mesotoga infera TaxID=1236046 RepID=A0A7C1H8I0_9BACT|nr:dihydroxyacetone kinase subunit DhaK [Mesotoga infera]